MLLISLLQVSLAHTQFYTLVPSDQGYPTISQNGGERSSKPLSASSTTECILKCKITNLTVAYFVQETSECYCMVNETEEIFSSQTNPNGLLYKKHKVKGFSCFSVAFFIN